MKLFDPIPGRKNSMAPGKARTTGMVPTMLLEDGKPVLLAGAPGGSVIISATLQAILNMIDFGMSPVEAVTVPRIHCEGKGIQAEATIQGPVVAALRAMGHRVVHSPHSLEPMMSRAHVISTLAGGRCVAGQLRAAGQASITRGDARRDELWKAPATGTTEPRPARHEQLPGLF